MSRQYREEASRLRAEQAEREAQQADIAGANAGADTGGEPVAAEFLVTGDDDDDDKDEDGEYDAFPHGGQKLGGS